jgi:hypothetical protein
MWEEVLPRRGIEMPRKEDLVEVFPQSHLVGRLLLVELSNSGTESSVPKKKKRSILRVL